MGVYSHHFHWFCNKWQGTCPVFGEVCDKLFPENQSVEKNILMENLIEWLQPRPAAAEVIIPHPLRGYCIIVPSVQSQEVSPSPQCNSVSPDDYSWLVCIHRNSFHTRRQYSSKVAHMECNTKFISPLQCDGHISCFS